MPTKSSSYRFPQITAERIEKLGERFQQSRTKVLEDAVYNLALQEGLLVEEAHDAIDELLADHGVDAIITFALQRRTTTVPVAINGKPTQAIRAGSWPKAVAYFPATASGPPPAPPAEPIPVVAFLPNTGITFDIGEHKPPAKVEMRLDELYDRLRPFSPRTAASVWFNQEVRRRAGYEPPAEEDEA
jgi:hypothetical protein